MRKIIVVIFVLGLCLMGCNQISPIDTSKYLSDIDHYLDSVDGNISSYKLRRMDVMGSSSEGGEIKVYHSEGDTVKIEAVYYGETGKAAYNLYLRDNKLVVFQDRSTFYQAPIGKEPVKIDSIGSLSFILKNDQIVSGKKDDIDIDRKNFELKLIEIITVFKQIKQEIERNE